MTFPFPVSLVIFGEVHRGHAAFVEVAFELVAVGDTSTVPGASYAVGAKELLDLGRMPGDAPTMGTKVDAEKRGIVCRPAGRRDLEHAHESPL